MFIIRERAGQQEIPVTVPISDQNKCDVASEDITALIIDYAITAPEHLHFSHVCPGIRDFHNWTSILQNAISGEDWVAYH